MSTKLTQLCPEWKANTFLWTGAAIGMIAGMIVGSFSVGAVAYRAGLSNGALAERVAGAVSCALSEEIAR